MTNPVSEKAVTREQMIDWLERQCIHYVKSDGQFVDVITAILLELRCPLSPEQVEEVSFTRCVFIGDPPEPHKFWQDWCASKQYSGVTIQVTGDSGYEYATAIALASRGTK